MNKPTEGILTEPYETTPIEVEEDNAPYLVVLVFLAGGFALCIVLGLVALSWF